MPTSRPVTNKGLACNASIATLATMTLATAWFGCAFPAFAAALRVSPTVDHPSATVKVRGGKFTPGEAVDVYFDTTDELLASANSKGAFAWRNLPVPADALPGTHWVTAVGRTSGTSVQKLFTVSTDWAEFHFSPLEEGANPYENVLSSGNVSSLNTAWTAAVSPYYDFPTSSPAVTNGVIFVGGYGQGGNGQELAAFDASSGAELWSAAVVGYVFTSPAVSNGVVYVSSLDGVVQAVNAATGASLWTETIPSTAYSPTVANGVVYVGCLDNNMYAFDAATGAPLWSLTTGGEIASSPAVANGVVYVSSSDGKLYALNAATGASLWTTTAGGFLSSPAVANGVVYVSSDDDTIYAFNAATGAVLWTVATGSRVYATPAVASGVAYVGSYDGKLYALNAATGAVLWTASTGSPIFSSAAVANGVVYVGPNDDNLHAFDAATGDTLWTAVAGNIVLSPAVANGMVYAVSVDGILHAYALDGGNNAAYRPKRAAPAPETLQPDWHLRLSR